MQKFKTQKKFLSLLFFLFYSHIPLNFCYLLTLPSPGCFWSFCLNLHSANTIEILKLFGGLGHSWHPCDQIHMGIGPTQAFLSELWGFKVDRGGHYDPPPEKVGLSENVHVYDIQLQATFHSGTSYTRHHVRWPHAHVTLYFLHQTWLTPIQHCIFAGKDELLESLLQVSAKF